MSCECVPRTVPLVTCTDFVFLRGELCLSIRPAAGSASLPEREKVLGRAVELFARVADQSVSGAEVFWRTYDRGVGAGTEGYL